LDIRIIIKIDNLIINEITGSPKQLASKLSITERTVYNYISFMKKVLNAPIVYDYYRMSYVYNKDGEFKFIR
jgi:transcriptional antiterminator